MSRVKRVVLVVVLVRACDARRCVLVLPNLLRAVPDRHRAARRQRDSSALAPAHLRQPDRGSQPAPALVRGQTTAETHGAVRAKAAPATAPAAPEAPAAPTTATLRIVSDVPGAQVFLNREFVGATPATANDLKPGSVSAERRRPLASTTTSRRSRSRAGEREVTIKFREVRLNASLDVDPQTSHRLVQGTAGRHA